MKHKWILIAEPSVQECSYCLDPKSPFTLFLQRIEDEDKAPKVEVYMCEQCYDNDEGGILQELHEN
jgi:hypothetical protein